MAHKVTYVSYFVTLMKRGPVVDIPLWLSEKGTEMQAFTGKSDKRRHFLGGSDARIIMRPDEAALIRLWKEKRGEAEPEDLTDNLVVQLGVATEALNRSLV